MQKKEKLKKRWLYNENAIDEINEKLDELARIINKYSICYCDFPKWLDTEGKGAKAAKEYEELLIIRIQIVREKLLIYKIMNNN